MILLRNSSICYELKLVCVVCHLTFASVKLKRKECTVLSQHNKEHIYARCHRSTVTSLL